MTAYDDLVAAKGAVAYWRLDDATAPFVGQIGGDAAFQYLGSVTPQGGNLLGVDVAALDGTLIVSGAVPFDTYTDYTLLAWVKISANQSLSVPVAIGNLFDAGLGVAISDHHTGGFGNELQGWAPAVGFVDSTPDSVSFDTDHLLGIKYEGGDAQLYLDGLPVGAPQAITPNGLVSGPQVEMNLQGVLGFVSIYDTGLSDADVLLHWETATSFSISAGVRIGTTLSPTVVPPPGVHARIHIGTTMTLHQGPIEVGDEQPQQLGPADPPLPVSTDPGIVVPTTPWIPADQYRSTSADPE